MSVLLGAKPVQNIHRQKWHYKAPLVRASLIQAPLVRAPLIRAPLLQARLVRAPLLRAPLAQARLKPITSVVGDYILDDSSIMTANNLTILLYVKTSLSKFDRLIDQFKQVCMTC